MLRASVLAMSRKSFPTVEPGYPFPALELARLEKWRQEDIFKRSIAERAGGPEFVFYEGPPTANNVPHVGHVVTRAVKDLIPRYRAMQGDYVARKGGWDTHGLPVEIEIEKKLGFTEKAQIEEYGIAEFNRQCLESVNAYEKDWRRMIERLGHWIDLDDPYFTYTNDYIESVWWSLAEHAKKDRLYRGYKIQPYCGRCGTSLSSHEVAQNYKDIDDGGAWLGRSACIHTPAPCARIPPSSHHPSPGRVRDAPTDPTAASADDNDRTTVSITAVGAVPTIAVPITAVWAVSTITVSKTYVPAESAIGVSIRSVVTKAESEARSVSVRGVVAIGGVVAIT